MNLWLRHQRLNEREENHGRNVRVGRRQRGCKVNRLRLLPRRLPRALTRIKRAAIDPLKVSSVSLELPVFIWGNGQSGTYLLYDLLSLSGAFVYPSVRGWRKKGLAHLLPVKPIEGEPTLWGDVGLPWDRVPVWVHDRVLTNRDVAHVEVAVVRLDPLGHRQSHLLQPLLGVARHQETWRQ